MNNRTEAKLTDLIGMQKAIEEILKQAWERGRKYGQNEERPTGEWIYIGQSQKGLKVVECTNCHKRQYGSLNYCGNCGADMRKG